MAHQSPLSKWLDKTMQRLDADYDKHRTTFEITFAVFFGVALMLLPVLPAGVELSMTWQYWAFVVCLWGAIFCAVYLIRNSRKKQDSMNELTAQVKMLIDEIRKDRNERHANPK